MKESDLQRLILDWLSLHRIFHYRNNSGAVRAYHRGKERFFRFGAKGSPDIVAVVKGRYIGIEVKGPHGSLSEYQHEFKFALEGAEGCYIVARCLEDVTSVLA